MNFNSIHFFSGLAQAYDDSVLIPHNQNTLTQCKSVSNREKKRRKKDKTRITAEIIPYNWSENCFISSDYWEF